MEVLAYVTVHKGLGDERFRLRSTGLSVSYLVSQLDAHTDWLWGIGDSYDLVRAGSLVGIDWDHWFLEESSCELRLIYLPYRVTSEGFPCCLCWNFVSWGNTLWYTRYNKVPPFLMRNAFFNTWDWKCRNYLYQPRQFFCSDCGPEANRLYKHVEEVHTDPVTLLKFYMIEV